MCIRAQAGHVIVFQSSESFVYFHLFESGFLEGSDWHDLALTFNCIHNVAESVLLSESLRWNLFAFEGTRSEGDLIREASLVNNLSFALSSEECLYLVENVAQFKLWLVQE